jgi:hypothetical protein
MWKSLVGLILVIGIWLGGIQPVGAIDLVGRIDRFPDWVKPAGLITSGELSYPDWFLGEWEVTSTLRSQFAPLAPEIVTPGFDRNGVNLDRPYHFRVKFSPMLEEKTGAIVPRAASSQIVADRVFNGREIATAYLGADLVRDVLVTRGEKVQQLTTLTNGTQLKGIVTGYQSLQPQPDRFIATEVTQQIFTGKTIYLNTVETTTDYRFIATPTPQIQARQFTAIYLSPQDPDYFHAIDKPVALYRYELNLAPTFRTSDNVVGE